MKKTAYFAIVFLATVQFSLCGPAYAQKDKSCWNTFKKVLLLCFFTPTVFQRTIPSSELVAQQTFNHGYSRCQWFHNDGPSVNSCDDFKREEDRGICWRGFTACSHTYSSCSPSMYAKNYCSKN